MHTHAHLTPQHTQQVTQGAKLSSMLNFLVQEIDSLRQPHTMSGLNPALKRLQTLGKLHAHRHVTPDMFVAGGKVLPLLPPFRDPARVNHISCP